MSITLESIAKVLVINEKNEALILTVGEYKARPDKSFKPDLPGGLVDPGETELIAVKRELEEETGIVLPFEAFALAYAKTESFAPENKSVTKFVYIARIDNTPPVHISWEHSEYEWVSMEVLKNTVELRPFYRAAVDYCFETGLLK